LGVTLINIEEERIFRGQIPETTYVNGKHIVVEPPLRLDLHVLFASNLRQYEQGLKFLSYVLMYFQAHSTFTQTEYPDLDPRIDRLSVELLNVSYEQLNSIWTFVGAKQLPSAVYKVRMLLLQDVDAEIETPLTVVDTKVHAS
jgi:hypothetical protein